MKGVYSVLPTPFTQIGTVDHESLKRALNLYISAEVKGITALGATSEPNKLTLQEQREILATVMQAVNGRVPVIVGTTAEGTQSCIELSKYARSIGAAAVMISPPRMSKLNSEVVVRHYKAVAEAVDIPIVIQDYPPLSGFFMEPSLLARVVREVPSARTIKMEDAPTQLKTVRILEQTKDIEVDVLGGLGGMYLLEELLAGAAGVMTGFAYPEILVEVVNLFNSGKRDEAAHAFYSRVALMRFEFQEGIGMAIRKEMLRRRGAFATALVRSPGIQLDESTSKALDSLLAWFKRKENPAWI